MLGRDTVKRRLESGISYTEFSYVLLQSMDFLNLYRDHGVTLQHGGEDQWGNITGGVELIRRADGGKAHAFVTPLVTKPDGTKYGKTEGDALWLDPAMMSPYTFHQWWLNVDDSQVGQMLRLFTFLLTRRDRGRSRPRPPRSRGCASGQKRLADEITTLVHGAEETEQAKAAAAALFGGGDLHALSPQPPWRRRCGRPERRRCRRCGPWSTCWSRPGWPRAVARPGAPSARAAPTSTTSGSRTPRPSRCPAT